MKVNYTIALSFSYRQMVAVIKFNGYFFIRYGGSHEIWGNAQGEILVMSEHIKGTTFASECRKRKFQFYDSKGKKVY